MTIAGLSDDELLKEVARLVGEERSATARLIAAIREIDARRLYLGQGCSSLFVYCTRALHLSEHAAYGRIEAARVAHRFPVVLEMLARGDLTLTTVCLLASHLTDSNHLDLLARARHRSKREVEEIVAHVRPRPDVPAAVRKLPERRRNERARSRDSRAYRTHGSADACASARVGGPKRRRHTSGAVALQAPTDHRRRDAGEAVPRARPDAACRAIRRSRGDSESRAGRAPEGTRTPEVGCRRATPAGPPRGAGLATHSRGGAARGVGTRWWPVRLPRSLRLVWRNGVRGVPPSPAVRRRWRRDD